MFNDIIQIFPEATINATGEKKLTRIQKCCLVLYLMAFTCGVIVLTLFFWEQRSYNSLEYRLETDHLHWTTPIPAISVCEQPNATLYSQHIAPSIATSKDVAQVAEFLNKLITPDTKYCTSCEQSCKLCPRDNYRIHVNKATKNCESLLKKCIWDEVEFDCCENFKLLLTKNGKCFTINSQQTDRRAITEQLTVSSWDKGGVMKLTLNVLAQIYLHDSKDVNFIKKQTSKYNNEQMKLSKAKTKGQITEIAYRYHEIRADSTAWSLTVEQRKCVLPDERQLQHHRKYSQSACRTECRMQKQVAMCNCTHHLLPESENGTTCNFEGLKCLDRHFKKKLKETKRKLKLMKIACDCPLECDVMEINIVHQTVTETEEDEISATITLQSPPKERIILIARVSWLDVLVCIACFSRLFTTSSLLSITHTICYIGKRIHYRRSGEGKTLDSQRCNNSIKDTTDNKETD